MSGQNINMRIDDQTLKLIDAQAKQAGVSRTQYILSWLPETYQRNEQDEAKQNNGQRR